MDDGSTSTRPHLDARRTKITPTAYTIIRDATSSPAEESGSRVSPNLTCQHLDASPSPLARFAMIRRAVAVLVIDSPTAIVCSALSSASGSRSRVLTAGVVSLLVDLEAGAATRLRSEPGRKDRVPTCPRSCSSRTSLPRRTIHPRSDPRGLTVHFHARSTTEPTRACTGSLRWISMQDRTVRNGLAAG